MTKINISNRSLYYHRQNRKKAKLTELVSEIECPRCSETMILCSDFDSLYYFCEECNFSLYTHKK
jgi:hypothetical protein